MLAACCDGRDTAVGSRCPNSGANAAAVAPLLHASGAAACKRRRHDKSATRLRVARLARFESRKRGQPTTFCL